MRSNTVYRCSGHFTVRLSAVMLSCLLKVGMKYYHQERERHAAVRHAWEHIFQVDCRSRLSCVNPVLMVFFFLRVQELGQIESIVFIEN